MVARQALRSWLAAWGGALSAVLVPVVSQVPPDAQQKLLRGS